MPTRPRRRRLPLLALTAIGAIAIALGAGTLAGSLGGPAAGSVPPVSGQAGPPPRFLDETAGSGVDFTFDGGFVHAVGGGVAAFDCDADGDHDLYFAGGEGPAALFRNDSEVGGPLRFTRLESDVTDVVAVNGAYPVGIRSGEQSSLVLLRSGENVILTGLDDCEFERANEVLAFDGGNENTQAFSATWESGEWFPTLAFGNYLEPGNMNPETRCQPNQLIRPLAPGLDGTAPYREPVLLAPSFCTLSMLFSDWSGTGRRDLRVSNDRAFYRQDEGEEQLWRLDPGEDPRLFTKADGWARVQVEGMGIASHDLTGDGRPEIYLTSQGASRLQTLGADPDRPAYVDIGLARNVNVAHPFTGNDMHLPSTAWHPEFGDVNNDGLMDLFVSKGNVTEQPDFAMEDPSNLLLGQPDGTFVEVADRSGIVVFDRGRGAALVDLNLDGRLDLVESFYGAPVRIWRNMGPVDGAEPPEAHWLALRIRQPGPNDDAIGAIVEIRSGQWRQRRELVIGGGHAGGQLGWLHVGLGPATAAEVRIRWPDGQLGSWEPVELDAFSEIERGAGVSPLTQPR